MKNNLKYLCIFFVVIAVSFTLTSFKNNSSKNVLSALNTKKDSLLILKQLKQSMQGTWVNVNLKADPYKHLLWFEIKGDTFAGLDRKEKYRIILKADSTFSTCQILTKEQAQTIKPKMSLSQKICKLTTDSLTILNYENGNKKYERYYKKR